MQDTLQIKLIDLLKQFRIYNLRIILCFEENSRINYIDKNFEYDKIYATQTEFDNDTKIQKYFDYEVINCYIGLKEIRIKLKK